MKEWKITIRTRDEAKALEYIDILIHAFKAAIITKNPMDFCSLENPDTKEILTCNLKKNDKSNNASSNILTN